MNTNEITLKNILKVTDEEQLQIKFHKMNSEDVVNKIKEKDLVKFKWIKWPKLYNEILKKIAEVLDLKIVKIIVDAWIKCDLLSKYKQVEEAKPGETTLIPIAEHSIDSQHHPHLEILMNDTIITEIEFEIKLTLHLKAIILKFQDKKLLEIHTGECSLSGNISCEKINVMDIESRKIELPGIIVVKNYQSKVKSLEEDELLIH